jgi:PAS domain S-box-containing protein
MTTFRVLYVDDEPDLLELGKLFLERSGQFTVDTITSSPAALALLDSAAYDAIVSDYMMPEMDGIAFLRMVRARRDHIPFILFTGRGREEIVIQALNEGADFYLQKGGDPIPQFTELSHKILQAIRKRLADVQLLESQSQLRTVVDSIQVGILTIDAKTHRILNANTKAIEMIGGDDDGIVGKICHQFICPAGPGSCPVSDPHLKVDLLEWILLDRNGNRIPVLKSVVPTILDGRDVLIESFFDISGQKRSENAFQTLIRSMVGGTGLASLDTITQNVNRWLGTDLAMIKEITGDPEYGRILSLQPGSGILPEDSQPLRGTPCGTVAEQGYYFCPDDLRARFPLTSPPPGFNPRSYVGIALRNSENRVIGTLCAFSRQPLAAPPQMQEILEIIGVKAAAEIERKQTEEEMRQKNQRLTTINELEREFAEMPTGKRVEELAAKKLSALSGAVVTVFSAYDPADQVQRVAAIEFAPGILESLPGGWEKLTRWLGGRPEDFQIPLKREMYLDIKRSIVGIKKTVTEISYGHIPPLIGASIQKLSGIDRFVHIAHIIDGELYGTSVIGLRPDQPDLSLEFLESFGHMVAVSLRRQHAELALRESEDRYRSLIENANEAILVIQDGRICFTNPKLEEIGEYSRKEFTEKPFLEFVHPDDRVMVLEQHKKRLSGEVLHEHYTFRILSRGGSVLWNEIRSSLITWDGRPAVLVILQDITERKNAEEALRESEAKFRAVMDQSIDGIIIVDFSGKLLFANTSVAKFTGYDPDLVGTLNVLDIISPEFRLQATGDFAMVAAGTDSYPREYKILGAKRNELWIECIAKKISFAGSPAMILSIRDLSGRWRAEEALRSRDEFFRQITENLSSVLYLHDRALNRFVYVSPAYEKIWMQSPKELYDNPEAFLAAVHPEDLPRLQESIRKEFEESIYTDAEFRIVRQDGTMRWIHSRNFPVIGGQGTVYRVAGISEDITDLRNSRSALEESEEKFRSLVEYALEAILIVDFDGTVLLANRATALLVELDGDAGLTGRNVMEFIAPESREEVIKDFRLVAGGHDPYLACYTVISAKGNTIIVECIGKAITYEGRHVDLISIHDITGRKKAEDALRSANRQLNLLTGITRHDILNKVSVIHGFLEIARKKTHEPGTAEYLNRISSATSAIRSQIEFTRIYEDLGTREPRWLALDEVMPRSSVPPAVTLDADLDGARVYADPMLAKVFFNLLDNSVRHGQRVSRIRVSSHFSGKDMVLVWEDNGTGIAADEKERIFERGFGKNTGLGMFLAREILSLTGISITETGVPGSGARFELLIPKGAYRVAGT